MTIARRRGKARLRVDLQAGTGVVPAPMVFTRSLGANRVNQRGYLEQVANNAPRISYNPALEYNHLLNPWFDGAVPGTPGTSPTATTVRPSPGGTTTSIVGTGVEDGIPYIDIGLTGTANFTGVAVLMDFDALASAAQAHQGETWSGSVYNRLISGDPIDCRLQLVSTTAAGAETGNNIGNTSDPTNAPLASQLVAMNWGGAGAGTQLMRFRYIISTVSGTTYNTVLRLGFPTLTQNATHILNRVPLATLAARRNGVPSYGLRGIEIEAVRTNQLRNSRAEGATTITYAPGAPVGGSNFAGVTNWFIQNRGSGLSIDVSPVSFAGRTGVRVRFYGTTPASPGVETIEFEARNVIGAQAGNPVTGSFEVRLAAGAFPAVSNFNPRILTFTNAGVLVDNSARPGVTTPAANLQTYTWTMTPGAGVGSNGWVCLGLNVSGWTANTAVDFTIDIFSPQIETARFASSRILPAVGTPAATTRFPDRLNAPWNSVAPRGEATLLLSGVPTVSTNSASVTAFLSAEWNATAHQSSIYSFNGTVFFETYNNIDYFDMPLVTGLSGQVPIRCGMSLRQNRVAVFVVGGPLLAFNIEPKLAGGTVWFGSYDVNQQMFGPILAAQVLDRAVPDALLQQLVNALPIAA